MRHQKILYLENIIYLYAFSFFLKSRHTPINFFLFIRHFFVENNTTSLNWTKCNLFFCISSFRLNDDDGKKHGNKFACTNKNGAWWWQAFEVKILSLHLKYSFIVFRSIFFWIRKGGSDSYLWQNWFYFLFYLLQLL